MATTEDADAELDETFTVGLTVSGTTETVTATDTATGTITNDDGALPAVTIADASAAEGDSLTFTVTLDKSVSGGLKVTPSFTDVTATEGTDYTENTTALTFAGTKNETQTFTVATTEDADLETDETFTVRLSVSGTSLPVTATDTATGTITNKEPPPGKPDAPAVTVHSSTSLSVSWTAPGGATVTDYNVQYRAGTSGAFTDAGLRRHRDQHDALRPGAGDALRSAGAGEQQRRNEPLVGLGNGHHDQIHGHAVRLGRRHRRGR